MVSRTKSTAEAITAEAINGGSLKTTSQKTTGGLEHRSVRRSKIYLCRPYSTSRSDFIKPVYNPLAGKTNPFVVFLTKKDTAIDHHKHCTEFDWNYFLQKVNSQDISLSSAVDKYYGQCDSIRVFELESSHLPIRAGAFSLLCRKYKISLLPYNPLYDVRLSL